jgi:hypothetical protein
MHEQFVTYLKEAQRSIYSTKDKRMNKSKTLYQKKKNPKNNKNSKNKTKQKTTQKNNKQHNGKNYSTKQNKNQIKRTPDTDKNPFIFQVYKSGLYKLNLCVGSKFV